MRLYFILSEWLSKKKEEEEEEITSGDEGVEKGKHYTLFLGMKIAAVIMRQCEVSEKV